MKENIDTIKSIIDSIHRYVWATIWTIIVLMVSWLAAVYLLAPDFYKPMPVFIHLIIGAALATQWYVCMYMFVLGIISVSQFKDDPDKIMLMHFFTAFFSISWLGVGIFFWFLVEWPFKYLVVYCFLPYYALFTINYITRGNAALKAEANK